MFDESIYEFQIKNGQEAIICKSYSDFLYKIRRIENEMFHVKITLHEGCVSPWIAINSSDLYFKASEGKGFPVTYTDAGAMLSFNSLIAAMRVISSESKNSKHPNYTYPDSAFKILAFFISEAARFEIIEHACYVLFNDKSTQYNWKDWKPLLNAWSNISSHAGIHYTFTVKDPQVRPVPISSSQNNIYDAYAADVHGGSILSKLHGDVESKYLQMEFSAPDEDIELLCHTII